MSKASIDIPGRQERFGFGGGWGAHTLIAGYYQLQIDTWILICRNVSFTIGLSWNASVLTMHSYSCTLQFWPWDFSKSGNICWVKKNNPNNALIKGKIFKITLIAETSIVWSSLDMCKWITYFIGFYCTVLGLYTKKPECLACCPRSPGGKTSGWFIQPATLDEVVEFEPTNYIHLQQELTLWHVWVKLDHKALAV